MLCAYCSTHNPENNRFCGECGQPLVRQQVTVPAEEHHYQTTISGPSFLGLTDTSESDETNYLLEEDRPRRSHLGWFLFSTIAFAALAVVGWMEWQAIKTGQIAVPWLKTTAAEPTPQQAAPPETATAAPSASASNPPESVSASPADQKPQSDGTEAASSANSNMAASSKSADDDTASSAKKSDEQATQESESRLAKESGQRKANAASDENPSEDAEAPAAKPASKTKSVSATPKPPDPRQNPMLISGEKYLYGHGVRQDCNQALIYFKGAAESNNAPAMSHLGAMYASGRCVTPNRVMAYKWFARAGEVEPANQWISRSMNMLWRDMTPQERASVAR